MAMSRIWAGMIALSLVFALMGGRGAALGKASADGAEQAVRLGITLSGSLCLWSGAAALFRAGGLQEKLSKALMPLLGKLYPTARKDPETAQALCGNVTANLLGLGNAATPLGIEAVRRMKALSGSADASDEMCLLIVMNTASVQLIPTTVAALRGSLGSAAPFSILPAVWVTSLLSVTAGILAAKGLSRIWR